MDKDRTTPPQGKQGTQDAQARKPYRAPVLLVYGNLKTLTRSLANGISDGMSGAGMTSTHN